LLVCTFPGGFSPKLTGYTPEGDRVYINGKRPKFSKPLQKGGELGVRDGFISHDDIIGATPSQTLKSNRGKPYRVTFPDLDTYISSMPRKVTPVGGQTPTFGPSS
jgi:tRNA A58 N-methylase Trm61